MKSVVAIACLLALGVVADQPNLGDMMRNSFIADMSADTPPLPNRLTSDGMPFGIAYSNVLEACGATTAQLVEWTCASISNGCDAGVLNMDRRDWLAYQGAIAAVGRHYVTNALPALEYSFRNSDNAKVFREAYSIVRIRGVDYDAFSFYGRLLHETPRLPVHRLQALTVALLSKTASQSYAPVVTNRVVWFFNEVSRECPELAMLADRRLCAWFNGYGTSSNRYENVSFALSNIDNSPATNYLNEVKEMLLTLPSGTMQLLSTNQFYNVED